MADNGGNLALVTAENAQSPPPAAHQNGGDPAQAAEQNGGQNTGDPDQAVEQNAGDPQAVEQNEGDHAQATAAAGRAAMGVAPTRAPALRYLDIGEAMAHEILIRLPAADVFRCRAVCRLFHDVTSLHQFHREHHLHHSPTPLFFFRPDLNHPAVPFALLADRNLIRVDLQAVDLGARAATPVIRFSHSNPALPFIDPRMFTIEGSCDGILLFSYDLRFYACNPCTRRWGRLPPLHFDGREIIGFYVWRGPLQKTEHRLLYHSGIRHFNCRYWIFTLDTPETPSRFIDRPAASEAIGRVLSRGVSPSFEMPPTVVAHRLHWLPQAAQPNSNVMVFDTVTEVFGWVPPPRMQEEENGPWIPVEGDQLLEINGMLAMTLVTPGSVDVWVLQDYVGQVWMHQYRILLPEAAIQENLGYDEEGAITAAVLAVEQERSSLVQPPYILFQCDAAGVVKQNYQLAGHLTVLSRYMFRENLSQYPFLPLRPSDVTQGDPPFFQGQ